MVQLVGLSHHKAAKQDTANPCILLDHAARMSLDQVAEPHRIGLASICGELNKSPLGIDEKVI